MTNVKSFLISQPWWNSRYTWGRHVGLLLVLRAICHLRIPYGGWDFDDLLS
jgi:hypothetical protein